MNRTAKAEQPIYTKAYISIGFRRVLFPLDNDLLLRALLETGYNPEPDLLRLPKLWRGHLESRGPLARKGDFLVSLNTERGFLGLDGPNPESLVEEFTSLTDSLEENGVGLEANASFYEYLGEGRYRGKRKPLEVFSEVSGTMPSLRGFKEVLGSEVGLFGFRVVNPGGQPNQEDWFELFLEPSVQQADKYYFFAVVMRRREKQTTIAFVKSFSKTLTDLVARLESGR